MRILAAWAAVVLLVLGSGSIAGLQLLDVPLVGMDDANIFFVYGRNLADGYGLVYNPGQERVEGFSSVVWVVAVAAASLAGRRLELVLVIVNLALLTAALTAAVGHICGDIAGDRTIPMARSVGMCLGVVFLVWVVARPEFLCWTVLSLMETGLWVATVLWASISGVRVFREDSGRRPGPAHLAVLSVLVLVRPEGIVLAVAIVILGAAADLIRGRSLLAVVERHGPSLLTTAGVFAGVTAGRMAYFGYPFPNTYYAKIPSTGIGDVVAGVHYLWSYATSSWLPFSVRSLRPWPQSPSGVPMCSSAPAAAGEWSFVYARTA